MNLLPPSNKLPLTGRRFNCQTISSGSPHWHRNSREDGVPPLIKSHGTQLLSRHKKEEGRIITSTIAIGPNKKEKKGQSSRKPPVCLEKAVPTKTRKEQIIKGRKTNRHKKMTNVKTWYKKPTQADAPAEFREASRKHPIYSGKGWVPCRQENLPPKKKGLTM